MRRHPPVPVACQDPVEHETGAQGERSSRQRSEQREHERQGMNGMRCNACERPALPDGFAGPADVECLEIAQAAVDRPEMVEGTAAAEVGTIDERDAEAALRRVVRDRQAVDAAAHDEHVEGGGRESIAVADHDGQLGCGLWAVCFGPKVPPRAQSLKPGAQERQPQTAIMQTAII